MAKIDLLLESWYGNYIVIEHSEFKGYLNLNDEDRLLTSNPFSSTHTTVK